jgi:hypothetical protein
LPAVLKGIKAQVGEAGRIGITEYAEYAALFSETVFHK